jgi:hypothetical protein
MDSDSGGGGAPRRINRSYQPAPSGDGGAGGVPSGVVFPRSPRAVHDALFDSVFAAVAFGHSRVSVDLRGLFGTTSPPALVPVRQSRPPPPPDDGDGNAADGHRGFGPAAADAAAARRASLGVQEVEPAWGDDNARVQARSRDVGVGHTRGALSPRVPPPPL